MELRTLQYFVTVAEELSFTQAARRLHISQPPLSAQIKGLEEELGVELLHRTSRHVELTGPGRAFLQEARAILEHVGRAKLAAAGAVEGFGGSLAIGVGPSVDLEVLPRALRAFREEYPGTEFCLRDLYHADQIRALREGSLDAGFLRLPLAARDERGLVVQELATEGLSCAFAEGHVFARRKRLTLESLRREPLILWRRHVAPAAYDDILAACRDAGFQPHVAFETDALQTALSLACAGFGVAVCPASAAGPGRNGVVFRRLSGRGLALRRGVVRPEKSQNPLAPAFCDLVAAICTEGPSTP